MYDSVSIPRIAKPFNPYYSYQQVTFGMGQANQTSGVQFVRLTDADAVGREAASIVADQIRQKPDAAIVFPTGNTPIPMYQALRKNRQIDWSQSRLFQLDEYVNPNPAQTPPYQTFAQFMERHLWGSISANKHYFRDYTNRPADYERLVMRDGGPDLVILGIGGNGHIAFNEPGSNATPDSPTRIEPLSPQTLDANFKQMAHQPGYPTQAITLGLKSILGAKRILLLATGMGKQDIVRRAFDPATPPSTDCPASWLKQHPNVTVITDFLV